MLYLQYWLFKFLSLKLHFFVDTDGFEEVVDQVWVVFS